VEKKEGFYMGRVLTFCADGMRPIPKSVFEDLEYRVEWNTMWGIFSYARVWKRE
jgi:hypothetical protein